MKKKKLTIIESTVLLPHIKRVLETGRPWEDKKLHHPAGAFIDAVLTIKGVTKNTEKEFEVNGWQWDWWQHFIYKDKDYILSGSGYYGGHCFYPDVA